MTAIREYVRSIRLPFFMRKKFLLWFSIVVLVILLVAIVWTWMLYEEVSAAGGRIRWKHITEPLALPLIAIGIYLVFVLLWIAVKLKSAQGAILRTAVDLTQPQKLQLNAGEQLLGEEQHSHRISNGSALSSPGRFAITNLRFLHSPLASAKRVGTLIGMQEPDVVFSIEHVHVRQCGFGLDANDPNRFAVIEMNGNLHSFYAPSRAPFEYAMRALGWKETRAGDLVYWIR